MIQPMGRNNMARAQGEGKREAMVEASKFSCT